MVDAELDLLTVIVAASAVVIAMFYMWMRPPSPPSNISTVHDPSSITPIAKQGFSMKKVPAEIDVIMVGAGVSGLTCGSLLAREGKRVLVLEQHDVAGGNFHTYDEKGYEFDTGVHYFGSLGPNGFFRYLMDYLFSFEGGNPITWAKLEDPTDTVCAEGKSIEIYNDWDVMKKEIEKAFPGESYAIHKHFEYIEYIMLMAPLVMLIRQFPTFVQRFLKFALHRRLRLCYMTVDEVLDGELKCSPGLRGFLSYQYIDYGDLPNQASFFMHAMVWNHFRGGGYYPSGGPSIYADRIIPIIERYGGKVLVRAPVSEIIVEDGVAKGVVVKGHKVYAKECVISSIGGPLTFNKLVPESSKHLVKDQIEAVKASKVASTMSIMTLFIGMKATKEEMNIPNRNTWTFHSWDMNKSFEEFKTDESAVPSGFISWSSTKDPTYMDRIPGRQVALVLSPNVYEHVEPFENDRVHKRSEAYQQKKEVWKKAMLELFLKHYPQAEQYIDFLDVGTGLSNNFYLGNYRGACYGLSHSPERLSAPELVPKTPIKNLYLTGQDTTMSSVIGATASGFSTAHVVCPKVRFRTLPMMVYRWITQEH